MNGCTPFKRLVAVVRHEPTDPPAAVGEREAALRLYSTSRRGVKAALKESGRVAGTTGRVNEERTLDGRTV